MTTRELAEYAALNEIDPFGEQRADLRIGILASLIANINRDPKKSKPFRPMDFMAFIPEEQRAQFKKTAETKDLSEAIKLAFRGFKKSPKKKRKRNGK